MILDHDIHNMASETREWIPVNPIMMLDTMVPIELDFLIVRHLYDIQDAPWYRNGLLRLA